MHDSKWSGTYGRPRLIQLAVPLHFRQVPDLMEQIDSLSGHGYFRLEGFVLHLMQDTRHADGERWTRRVRLSTVHMRQERFI